MAKHWIVVGTAENFRIARGRHFDMFGFKSTRRREAGEMEPGDKLVFYLVGVMKMAGTAEVTSDSFEDHTPVFKSEKKPGEDYPWRVHTKPLLVLDEEDWLDAREIGPRLRYTQKWIGGGNLKNLGLAFQGNLHLIPQEDFELIEREMKAAAGVKA